MLNSEPKFMRQNKKFEKNIFSKKTSVIFLSLASDDFGIVKNVSNSFASVFNYDKSEVVGKNCSCLMPRNIGVVHDKILKNYISRGHLDHAKFKKA